MNIPPTQDRRSEPPVPIDTEQWPPELSAVANDMNGKPINVHKLMANNPALLNAWWTFRNHSVSGGTLGLRKVELLILRVGVHMNCWYEWASHVDRAVKVGIGINEIHRVLELETDEHWSTDEGTLLQAVDELTRSHTIKSETLATLEQHFSTPQIMDLIAIHGMYLILAGMIKTWGLALDPDVLERITSHTNETSFHSAAQLFRNNLN